jgi:hypothetical protein
MVQHGSQIQRIAQGGANQPGRIFPGWGSSIEGRYWVWSNEGGNGLTYRQVSQVTDTPDEVKTCPTHYTPPPQERERSYIGGMEIKTTNIHK